MARNKRRKFNNLKKAVGYCRYSCPKQREESIKAQERAIKEYAEKHGITMVGWFVDRGTTGTNADREEWQRLKEVSKFGNFGLVLVHKENRFSRQSLGEQETQEKELAENGVRLVSVTEIYENNASGKFAKNVNRLVSHHQSLVIGEEVIKGMKENVFSGKTNGGHTLYGYEMRKLRDASGNYVLNSKERVVKEIAIDIERAEAVKIMFEMLLNGYKRSDIIDRLNVCGFKNTSGKSFTATSIDNLLRNPKYAGIYRMYYNKKELDYDPDVNFVQNDNGYPAIISKELFYAVQKILEQRVHRSPTNALENYLLVGKMVCEECGSTFMGDRNAKNGKAYVRYKCSRTNKEIECSNNTVRKEDTEKYIIKQIKKMLLNDEVAEKSVDEFNKYAKGFSVSSSMVEMLEGQIKKFDTQILNVMEAIKNGSSSQMLLDELSSLEKSKEVAEQNLAREQQGCNYELATASELRKAYAKALDILENGEFADRKAMLNNFINKVVIGKNKVEIFINVVPLSMGSGLELNIEKDDFLVENENKTSLDRENEKELSNYEELKQENTKKDEQDSSFLFLPIMGQNSFGSPGGIRTYDPSVNSRMLLPLSYRGIFFGF